MRASNWLRFPRSAGVNACRRIACAGESSRLRHRHRWVACSVGIATLVVGCGTWDNRGWQAQVRRDVLGAPLPRYTSGASLSGCSCQQSTATPAWCGPTRLGRLLGTGRALRATATAEHHRPGSAASCTLKGETFLPWRNLASCRIKTYPSRQVPPTEAAWTFLPPLAPSSKGRPHRQTREDSRSSLVSRSSASSPTAPPISP